MRSLREGVNALAHLLASPSGEYRDAMSIAALGHLLRHSELRQMLDFASPAFWQVIPPTGAWNTVRALMKGAAAEAVMAGTQRWLADAGGPVELAMGSSGALSRGLPADPSVRGEIGERILSLYFRQLFERPEVLVDFGPSAFSSLAPSPRPEEAPPGLVWHPRRYSLRWPTEVIAGLRDVYRGFYGGDDVLFDHGLGALHLSPARDAFLRQFGATQDEVRFSTEALLASLHESFVACRDAKETLPPAFLAFGYMLTTLYQTLELMDLPLNVRRAFVEATSPR